MRPSRAMSGSVFGSLRLAAVAIGLAAALGLQVVLGAYLGWFLDRAWGISPWMTLSGAFVGLLAGTMLLLSALKGAGDGRPAAGRR